MLFILQISLYSQCQSSEALAGVQGAWELTWRGTAFMCLKIEKFLKLFYLPLEKKQNHISVFYRQ